MGKYANFYNSVNGDRKYDAESFEEFIKPFFNTGVFKGDLQVTAKNGMTINVASGYVNINGKTKYFEEDTPLTLDKASTTFPRVDTIVVRRDDTKRDFEIAIVKGNLSTNPKAKSPVRSGDIYELVLAEISIGKTTTSISSSLIKDKRSDTTVCGYVTTGVDNSTIIDLTHPVGSILMTENSANPSTYWAGTSWIAWGSGRVPVGVNANDTDFNTVGKTGGEKSVTLTTSQIPTHTHKGRYKYDTNYEIGNAGYKSGTDGVALTLAGGNHNIESASAGSGSEHNNLQPYITCYMWKRTA